MSAPGSDADRRWLDAMWPFVRDHLPPAPGLVVDIGCGPLGGFVPALRADGYDAEGVDPEAPDGAHYHRVEFERYTSERPAAAIVASTSLHHVADLAAVVDLIAARLEPGGVLVVIEWARERFDEATARWCFDRLPTGEPGWLHHHRDDWLASGRLWPDYLRGWAETEHLHTGQDILAKLGTRFDTRLVADGPYFFPDLAGVTAADEQVAIDTGQIQANGIRRLPHRPLLTPPAGRRAGSSDDPRIRSFQFGASPYPIRRASQTRVAIADDLATGMIDRFRALPMTRSAIFAGRTSADAIRNLLGSTSPAP